MKRHLLQLTWLGLLLTTTPVLVWRIMDFTYEAGHEGFHMTRGGFGLRGAYAEVLQLVIIFVCVAVIWKAIDGLVRSHPTNPLR